MSLLVFVVVAFAFAGLAAVTREDVRARTALGLVGLTVALGAAIVMDPDQVLAIGGGGIATTAYLRLFLVLGSLVGLGLAVSGLAGGSRRDAPAVTLAILAACGLTLGLVDPRAAVLAATAGGLFGVLVTLIPGNPRAGATVGIRETRAVVVAGALAIAATAWFGRDLSQLAAQPVVFGLAYLAFAVAVAMRFGAIPFHLWAARLTDVVPETALPILTAMAPASLAIVALAWTDASVTPLLVDVSEARLFVLGIAIASIVLAAIAAFVQDDLEHVLGYSIVGDAGVVMLALATLDPEAWAPARTWILVFVVARSAFAAWVAGIRAGFWTGRIADLRGWVWRSPLLTVAFALVVIASVGFPGLVAFDARRSIVDLALDAPLSIRRPAGDPRATRLLRSARQHRPGAAGPGGRSAGDVDAAAVPTRHGRSPALGRRGLGGEPGVHDGRGGGSARPARARHIGRWLRRSGSCCRAAAGPVGPG